MNKLYLFNPDHELALANFDPNYMPSSNVQRLATDLALLPVWYADEKDSVLAPSAYNKIFLEEMQQFFPHLPSLCSAVDMGLTDCELQPSPWGWNPVVLNKLHRLGMRPDKLLSQEELQELRVYSSRLLAVELLPKLVLNENFCGESHYFTHIEEICDYVESRDDSILKAPLSSSGKGLIWCEGKFTLPTKQWCTHILKQQGGVVAEPLYKKELDFSMQFHVNKWGVITFAGYSLFRTTASGAYMGNWLTNNDRIVEKINKYVPKSTLMELRLKLVEELSRIIPKAHVGYFGVDMMVCRSNNGSAYKIHPCVEINLRMTMGMVCRSLYDHYLHPGVSGNFLVDFYPSSRKLKITTELYRKTNPLIIIDGKIAKGYLPLVPVTPDSHHHAWALIS
jgi:hypothetical protein